MFKFKTKAFTLIELSIVLVIIGLIAGGVLVGQDLIRAAKNRKVISEIEDIKLATNTFQLKYACLPGDCKKAVDFWGTDPTGCSLPINTNVEAGTCNGNGDKRIGDRSHQSNVQEVYRAMQQLNLADFMNAELTGTAASNYYERTVGLNTPSSQAYRNGGFLLMHQQNMGLGSYGTSNGSGVRYWEATPRGHVIHFVADGLQPDGGHDEIDGFTAIDAYSIDKKVDDGKPQFGLVVTQVNQWRCHTTQDASTAEYDINGDDQCQSLIFNAGF